MNLNYLEKDSVKRRAEILVIYRTSKLCTFQIKILRNANQDGMETSKLQLYIEFEKKISQAQTENKKGILKKKRSIKNLQY